LINHTQASKFGSSKFGHILKYNLTSKENLKKFEESLFYERLRQNKTKNKKQRGETSSDGE
jgi:hypothetical protein